MHKAIVIKIVVPGYHYWADAPKTVAFLRHTHRHLFHIRVSIEVTNPDRQYEFFIEQRKLIERMGEIFTRNAHNEWLFSEHSCEQIAEHIIELYPYYAAVEVTEDDENGGLVWK